MNVHVAMPATSYAVTDDDVHIAYQVFGQGERDLLLVWGFLSHVEMGWEDPHRRRFLERLATFARVIHFDKRGMGMSDPVPRPPTLEERVRDITAVLDAAGAEHAVLLGFSEGAPASILAAALHPDRVHGLVLYGGMARSVEADDHPWATPADVLWEANRELIAPMWGEGVTLETFAPSAAGDPEARAAQARMERYAAPRGVVRDLFAVFLEIDVRAVLPAVRVPTLVLHRRHDRAVNVRASRYLAEHIDGARLVELDGIDHVPWRGDADAVLDEVAEFVTGTRPVVEPDRVLRTVLFTDLVASTARAAQLGDRAWLDLLARHQEAVRSELRRHGGREVKTLGDGFLAVFDGPARAIRCAVAAIDRTRELGLDLRAGVHTGECELVGDDVGGIAVHIAARVVGRAATGEVLVTGTVEDLVVGSAIAFEDRGVHELEGVPGRWRLAAVTAAG